MSFIDPKATIELANHLIQQEAQAISALQSHIDADFVRACECLIAISGRIVLIGIGKSGHISRKIAATMASTGSPAFFVSAAEACHGDLGMICKNDAVMMLSNSGESDELVTLLPALKSLSCPIVTLTGDTQSTLARNSHIVLDVSVSKEACPLGLAPTTSTAAMLAMGDALAVCLLSARGFNEDDFARSHPGGKLGKRLLTLVEDIMHTDNTVPRVNQNNFIKDGLLEISSKGLGLTTVVDDDDYLVGVFTDGDLRRLLDKETNLQDIRMRDVMVTDCQFTQPQQLATKTLQQMQANRISAIPVVDDNNKVIGALNMHDLLNAGIL